MLRHVRLTPLLERTGGQEEITRRPPPRGQVKRSFVPSLTGVEVDRVPLFDQDNIGAALRRAA